MGSAGQSYRMESSPVGQTCTECIQRRITRPETKLCKISKKENEKGDEWTI